MVSHQFYFGDKFYEQAPLSAAIMVLFLAFSMIPSMYNFISLIQLELQALWEKKEAWRFFSGLFCATNPQYFFLCMILLFMSRSYEYSTSTYAMLNLLISTLIFVAIPSVCLNFWDRFEGTLFFKYPNALIVSFTVSNIIRSLRSKSWSYKSEKGLRLGQSIGAFVLLLFLYADGWSIHGAMISAIGTVFGILFGLKVPPFYWPCLAKLRNKTKQRKRNHQTEEENIGDIITEE